MIPTRSVNALATAQQLRLDLVLPLVPPQSKRELELWEKEVLLTVTLSAALLASWKVQGISKVEDEIDIPLPSRETSRNDDQFGLVASIMGPLHCQVSLEGVQLPLEGIQHDNHHWFLHIY